MRFFAALLVLLHHSATIGRKYGLFDLENVGLFRNGANAVNFFFVLSGFLITYLLQKEQSQTQNINIKRFYLRRIRRIWPLYFLLIAIGTIFLPLAISISGLDYQMPYSIGQTWYYFLFFCPIMVLHIYGHHLLEPLWSIGVEEIFYLMWAPLVKFFKKHLPEVIFATMGLKIATEVAAYFFFDSSSVFYLLAFNYNFESMAIGALGAYLLFNAKSSIENKLCFKPIVRLPVCSLVLLFLFFNINIDNAVWNALFFTPIVSPLILSFLYLYVIFSAVLFCKPKGVLENKVLVTLGEISYGIYMYHCCVMFSVVVLLSKFKDALPQWAVVVLFLSLAVAITLVVSYFSKRWFEDWFLQRNKSKVSK